MALEFISRCLSCFVLVLSMWTLTIDLCDCTPAQKSSRMLGAVFSNLVPPTTIFSPSVTAFNGSRVFRPVGLITQLDVQSIICSKVLLPPWSACHSSITWRAHKAARPLGKLEVYAGRCCPLTHSAWIPVLFSFFFRRPAGMWRPRWFVSTEGETSPTASSSSQTSMQVSISSRLTFRLVTFCSRNQKKLSATFKVQRRYSFTLISIKELNWLIGW